jgi:hypothetical protein
MVVLQFVQKPQALPFRGQVYRPRNLLFLNSAQPIPRAIVPGFGMTSPWNFYCTNTSKQAISQIFPVELADSSPNSV